MNLDHETYQVISAHLTLKRQAHEIIDHGCINKSFQKNKAGLDT